MTRTTRPVGERELAEEIAYWAPAQARRLEVDFLLRRFPRVGDGSWSTAARGRPETEDGIDVWPVETFSEALAENRLWN